MALDAWRDDPEEPLDGPDYWADLLVLTEALEKLVERIPQDEVKQPELHIRAKQLLDRSSFGEAGRTDQGTILKQDAYVAWLDMRKLWEDEIIPALWRAQQP
ncbi:hypothetical protein [Novosphingobium huizhouense]|uniref:hypothetical protein n=1 Tax=Novosphingobium huizhouense TaxID=2866625 RepID=UPI001CD8EB4F|nr:hypothetical protein [Novosphingobium huizhouense]